MIKQLLNKLVHVTAAVVTIASFNVQAALAAQTNQIQNADLAATSQGMPIGWQQNAWGDNAATFSYKQDGHSTAGSVYIRMRTYKSGDAKWFFNPVAVEPNKTYTYSESFKANVATRVVAALHDQQQNITYTELSAPPSSLQWSTFNGSFTTLPSTVAVSVYHVIDKNGWLQVDDVSLHTQDVNPSTQTIVPNPSLEVASPTNPNQPNNWTSSSWGNNSASFTYPTNGKDGTRSVKVSVSNYVDGDAKWYFEPQELQPGKDYQFTASYRTNTLPHVVAQYTMQDGSVSYYGMPRPQPVGRLWQQYTGSFSVPQNTANVTVFFYVSSNGWVQTDSYAITPYTFEGFTEPMVTLTFDDGFEENISTAIPVLNQYGFKTTHCFATQHVQENTAAQAIIRQYADAGHEICAHSVTHPFLTQLTNMQVIKESRDSQRLLQTLSGQPVSNFASPFGDYNASVNSVLMRYYASHRTTDEGYNSKDNLDPYRLRVQNMTPKTSLAQVQEWVNKAKADRTWLILVYHAVKTDTASMNPYDTLKADFDAQMQWLSQSGVEVVRWDTALARALAQK